ncbi:OmpA/MotB family protein [Clostridium luticellarii]|jgi:chemotaxis protein MotB|uniref:Motility protein B n=1 Tax=Clostridium luticellarii TaxID=1691940 RepID=A0A2T0B870_9CLOT|nr:flagellar motor protein MotB [Clostridium luticellarii]MCI1944893.1 flagellar motor protein MotB [Clostridium luticellarii]MCI1968431.1 flagellar motor protein MotB [Clostridium luticellarii]MCI1995429.1 flagellar motor protein MotB [Clostridium luticellarii]MCI2039492.1 flagellar motor protein MotB [Clostridium luticellarii]PRR80062.1 Motility protein B [Clostridium luticellarii]
MKKKKSDKKPDGLRWMLTYSDLITLLMIFFIVMYSMSQVDQTKYKQLSESLSIAMGGGKTIIGEDNNSSIKNDVTQMDELDSSQDEEKKLEELKKKVDKYLQENGMSKNVSTSIDERGLVISMNDTLLFDTGKADIRPEFQQELTEMGKILNQLGNYIRIEGHTDNVPISNDEYSSNWKLSCDRASNVTEFLIMKSGIQPQKLSAIGYGEYRPIADNSSEAGKAKNRRVDIIILNSKFNAVEDNSSSSTKSSKTGEDIKSSQKN